jgi:phosphoenolpyruvate carboxykinase (ATP)
MDQTVASRGHSVPEAKLFGLGTVHWNQGVPALYEHVMQRGEARLSRGGALIAMTGTRTGRSPLDRFIVKDSSTAYRGLPSPIISAGE